MMSPQHLILLNTFSFFKSAVYLCEKVNTMKYTITESRLRDIIREAVVSSLNGSEGAEHEYAEMTGQRFDEILRQNGITVDDLIGVLPDIDIETIIDYMEEGKSPDEDNIRESWEDSVYDSKDFEEFVRSLDGLTRQDIEAVDGYIEAWYCESNLVKQAFQKMYEQACDDADEEYQDILSYRSDPLRYYGMSPYDFV